MILPSEFVAKLKPLEVELLAFLLGSPLLAGFVKAFLFILSFAKFGRFVVDELFDLLFGVFEV